MKKMLFMALALLMAEGAMAARIDLSTLKNGETFYAKNNDQLYSKLSSNAKIRYSNIFYMCPTDV